MTSSFLYKNCFLYNMHYHPLKCEQSILNLSVYYFLTGNLFCYSIPIHCETLLLNDIMYVVFYLLCDISIFFLKIFVLVAPCCYGNQSLYHDQSCCYRVLAIIFKFVRKHATFLKCNDIAIDIICLQNFTYL